ncbi:MAG: aminoglycoside phosphotransferase [Candidatus Gottesmanbacteria bacterium GW2011_GWA2_43_14]|uniref:Aminoglycoside phosphotransferase n=1 Tax=Candidatus Gottesmanbacteria bacterium GW2011_GWA2_43_14 TaxID=1618443 RepID=A0A0G1DIW7_9BACT|nr:MAG: aminoglycoside phosphotransferase [Candidatus Gottesmanbacteria bacterium GW2011_GWA2_43_14]
MQSKITFSVNKLFFSAGLDQVLKSDEVKGGANSRTLKVTTDSSVYFLKIYPQSLDGRKRLKREYQAVKFFNSAGIDRVPAAVYADYAIPAGIYSFIPGDRVNNNNTEIDVKEAIEFISGLKKASGLKSAVDLPDASEACFSVRDVLGNIKIRRNRLGKINHPHLKKFLTERFDLAFVEITDKIVDSECAEKILSPSDFGFHNAIRGEDGRLYFIDMEHFGWDDPVKLLSDFLLHPEMKLSGKLKESFLRQAKPSFKTETFERLKIVYPLFALKWSLIMLNEFTREGRLRRTLAQKSPDERGQLKKAGKMLEKALSAGRRFPFASIL